MKLVAVPATVACPTSAAPKPGAVAISTMYEVAASEGSQVNIGVSACADEPSSGETNPKAPGGLPTTVPPAPVLPPNPPTMVPPAPEPLPPRPPPVVLLPPPPHAPCAIAISAA